MALPSAFTIGSVAFVVAAGVGLAAVASNASDDAVSHQPVAQPPTTSSTPGPTKTTGTTPTKVPRTRQHHERRTPVPEVFVEVYNNSGVTGLAASRAKVLERAGWNVTATDNWYGNIPANTVYFPGTMRPAARQLAKVLNITRVRPAVSPMQFDRLTVILTAGS